jgi:hypothetical protein
MSAEFDGENIIPFLSLVETYNYIVGGALPS